MYENFIEKYNNFNNRFKKKLIFKIGATSGFYSELNLMIFFILYCLQNKIKFVLFSDNANFALNKGWEEFFLPFVEQNHDDFHKKYNFRFKSNENRLFIKNSTKIINEYKKTNKVNFLTYELFDLINNNLNFAQKHFNIKNLDIKGNSIEASTSIAQMVYNFNDETKKLVNSAVNSLSLPDEYSAIHIRAGDIETESVFRKQNLLNVDAYIEKIEEIDKNVKNVFIFTDDYRHVTDLKRKKPEWNIYTLCNSDETGYINDQFNSLSWEVKKQNYIKLFANVDICQNSTFFVGTYTSNPDWFLNMTMPKNKFYCADCDEIEWQVQRDKTGLLSKYARITENDIKTEKIGFWGFLRNGDNS
jgi:hypothetical protein